MSGIENTIIARYEHAGDKFELFVDPKNGYAYKTGLKKDLANVLVVEEVFKDAKKGERQSPGNLKKAFGTTDVMEIAKKIFKDGDLQITTEQRHKLLVEKRAKIIAFIARDCLDPRTKAPHPPARIEAAMEQARVSIDAFKSAEEQVQEIIEELREIIPISMEQIKVEVVLAPNFVGRGYGLLKEYGMKGEEYGSDGSMTARCEMPAGLEAEFYDKLNKMTSGQVVTRRLDR